MPSTRRLKFKANMSLYICMYIVYVLRPYLGALGVFFFKVMYFCSKYLSILNEKVLNIRSLMMFCFKRSKM